MYDVYSKSGARYWRPIIVDPIGRTIQNKEICLNRDQIIKLLEFVKEKRRIKSKLDTSLGCAHFFGEYEAEVREEFFYCATGINIGSILHNGDIYVCPNVPRRKEFIYGNIKQDKFSKIWDQKFKFFRKKDRTSNEKCLNCEHWEECLGGSFHSWNMSTMEQKMCLMS
jgi:radical SAM protein with 4Fe4S-binding SPASM domain